MKKLVWVVTVMILLGVILVKSAAAETTVVIIGGWGSTENELGFLHEQIPNSIVIALRKYLPLDDAATVLYEQLAEKKITGQVIFIAHSWGGLIARAFAAKYSEMVEKIIQIGSPNGGYWFAPKFIFRVEANASKDTPLFIIAGTKSEERWSLRPANDGTVDVSSVLAVKAEDSKVLPLGHMELLQSTEVAQQIRMWLGEK